MCKICWFRRFLAVLSLAGAAAGSRGCGEGAQAFDGVARPHVVSAVRLPTSGQDFVRTGNGGDAGAAQAENRLGALLAVLAPFLGANNTPQALMDRLVTGGRYLVLLDLWGPPAGHDGPAALAVAEGRDPNDDATDNFTGYATFAVAPGEPPSLFSGEVRGGRLRAGPGSLSLLVPLGMAAATLRVVDARITGGLSGAGITGGVITGAVQLDDGAGAGLYYSLAVSLRDLQATPGLPASLRALLRTLDTDGNGRIDPADLRTSPLVGLLAAPDVDTDHDGAADAVSVGIGFSAAPCRIAR